MLRASTGHDSGLGARETQAFLVPRLLHILEHLTELVHPRKFDGLQELVLSDLFTNDVKLQSSIEDDVIEKL